jgi:hypothetical protein
MTTLPRHQGIKIVVQSADLKTKKTHQFESFMKRVSKIFTKNSGCHETVAQVWRYLFFSLFSISLAFFGKVQQWID